MTVPQARPAGRTSEAAQSPHAQPPRPSSTATAQIAAVAARARHLRLLIETQPASLMRVGVDGTLLAVNDVGVHLLGGDDRDQLLGRPLVERLVADAHDGWNEFLARTGGGVPGSFECGLALSDGDRRTMLFHGVPIADPPDGIASVLVTAQDRSAWAKVEEDLVANQAALRSKYEGELSALRDEHDREREADEREAREQAVQLEAAETRLAQARAERDRFAAQVAKKNAEHRQYLVERDRITAAVKARGAQYRKLQAAHDRLAAAVAEKDAEHQALQRDRDRLAAEVGAKDEAHQPLMAERDRLAAEVAAKHDQYERLVAERESEQVQVQQVLARVTASHQRLAEYLDDACARLGETAAALDRHSAALLDRCRGDAADLPELADIRRDVQAIARVTGEIVDRPAARGKRPGAGGPRVAGERSAAGRAEDSDRENADVGGRGAR